MASPTIQCCLFGVLPIGCFFFIEYGKVNPMFHRVALRILCHESWPFFYHESWAKFDSNLTQWIESVESIKQIRKLSRVKASHDDWHLSQSWVIWKLLGWKVRPILLKSSVNISVMSIALKGKKRLTNTSANTSNTPPHPGLQFLALLSKAWGMVESNFESTLTQMSWVRVESLKNWVESDKSVKKSLKWVESESSHLQWQMSQSRVSRKTWVEHNPDNKVE